MHKPVNPERTESDLTAIQLWTRDGGGYVTLADGLRHGLFLKESTAKQFLDHVHPDDSAAVRGMINAIRAGQDLTELQYRLQVSPGNYRWIIERSLPVMDGAARSAQIVNVAFDVTSRNMAAQRLRESEQRFRDIAEVAGDWIWEMDADLRFTYLSERFYQLFRLMPSDILGKTREEFAGVSTDDPVWRQHLDDLAKARPIREFRYGLQLPHGAEKYFEINGKAVFDAFGAFQGYRGTGTDQTSEVVIRSGMARSEKQFRDLVEGSIQGLYIHKNWKIQFANQALADMFGYDSPEALLALETLEPLIHPDDVQKLRDYSLARLNNQAAPEIYEAKCRKRDGATLWVEFRVKLVEWHGETAIQCAVVDVTDRKKAEEALQQQNRQLLEQNERFTAALENMTQGLSMFDAEQRLVVCNKRYAAMYGLRSEQLLPGMTLRDILDLRIANGIFSGRNAKAYIQERMKWVGSGVRSSKIQELSDGRAVAITHQPMSGGGWLTTHEDITELQRVQEQIVHMAHHDALTDLPNRVLLLERIEQMLPQAKNGKDFAVLCLDLDRFKSVNETLGHPVGDDLLKTVAERLQDCVNEADTIARLGGDEFAIVQVTGSQPEEATALANRICEVIERPFQLEGGHQVITGVSIGIAIAPNDGLDANQLLKNADIALYRAKSDGRGMHRFFETGMDARMQVRRQLELDLREALETGEFELYYQPLVSLETNQVSGFEGLLRWNHPERGLVGPGEFIPLAEEIGLIVPMGEWVIRTACAQAATWPAKIKVAVNLSPLQFSSENLVPTVFSALANSGIAAGRLELEITEAVLLHDTEATLEILHQLRDMGVRIALDDFGTGYSSLSYLRSFPFDKIKIDRSFVADLSRQEGANVIVDAVASLSRSLGMMTTAEGVETEEQLQKIRAAGYNEMQGYLVSPPRSASVIADMFFPADSARAGAPNTG